MTLDNRPEIDAGKNGRATTEEPVAAEVEIEDEREKIARQAMDKLYKEMSKRGIVTTMMYDFGISAIIAAMTDHKSPLKAEQFNDALRKMIREEIALALEPKPRIQT